jgi:uncharacterized membrane protein
MWVWLALSAFGGAMVALWLHGLARTKEGRATAGKAIPVIVLVLAAVIGIVILTETDSMSDTVATYLMAALGVAMVVGRQCRLRYGPRCGTEAGET